MWKYQQITRQQFEERKDFVESILLELGAVPTNLRQKATASARTVFRNKNGYYRVDEVLFHQKPFIVIEWADRVEDIIIIRWKTQTHFLLTWKMIKLLNMQRCYLVNKSFGALIAVVLEYSRHNWNDFMKVVHRIRFSLGAYWWRLHGSTTATEENVLKVDTVVEKESWELWKNYWHMQFCFAKTL